MTLADVPLASGLQHLVDCLIEAVWSGVRGIRAGGRYAGSSLALCVLNRLTRIVRFVFLIVATQIELEPARRCVRTGVRAARTAHADRAPFRIFPPRRSIFLNEDPAPTPAAFAGASRDLARIVDRKRCALLAALQRPLPHIRRMARRLETQLTVFGWFPPRHAPPPARREFSEEEESAFREAWHQVRTWRRRRFNMATQGASAS